MTVRAPKTFLTKWISPASLRAVSFRRVFGRKNVASLINDKFIDMVDRRRSVFERREYQLWLTQTPIYAVLCLTLIKTNINFTIVGLSLSDARSLREVLIVVAALLGFASSFVRVQREILEEVIGGYIEQRLEKDRDAIKLMRIGFGLDTALIPPAPSEKHVSEGRVLKTVQLIFGLLFFFLLIGLFALAFYLHFLILSDIYTNPNFSKSASIWVIGFVIAVDILTLCLTALRAGIFPYRDEHLLFELAQLAKTDPSVFERARAEMSSEFQKRSFFGRILSRPKLKKLPNAD